jgi:hypothetical protein
MVLRVASSATARWVEAAPEIVQPVVQPFTDEPISTDAQFEPTHRTAKKFLAVMLVNDGNPSAEVVIQVAITQPNAAPSPVPPRLWAESTKPAADVALARRFISQPVHVSQLSESSGSMLPKGFQIQRLPLPEDFLVCALTFWKGKLLVDGCDGELRSADDTDRDGLPDRYRYFGGVLDQINNLRTFNGELYAATPGAVYRIQDSDGDELADSFTVVSSAWDWSGHPFDWLFGLVRDEQGNLYGATTTPHERGRIPGLFMRGTLLKISRDGKTTRVGPGTRYNFGWAQNRAGRRYFIQRQPRALEHYLRHSRGRRGGALRVRRAGFVEGVTARSARAVPVVSISYGHGLCRKAVGVWSVPRPGVHGGL